MLSRSAMRRGRRIASNMRAASSLPRRSFRSSWISPSPACTDFLTEAARRGLLVAAKPDSHEICFIPDGDAAGFVARQLGTVTPGPITDTSGKTLGEHGGIHRFTIGQRKGLGLAKIGRAHV